MYFCGFILFLTIPLRFLLCEIFHNCSTLQFASIYAFTCNSVDLPFGKFNCLCSSVCTESLTNEMNFVQWNLLFDQDPVDVGSHGLQIGCRQLTAAPLLQSTSSTLCFFCHYDVTNVFDINT